MHKALRTISVAAILLNASVSPASASATLETFVANDMQSANETIPAGVPTTWDWALRPRLNAGLRAEGYRALMPWGQIYACAGANPQPNARIEFKNMRAFVLSSRTGQWTQVTNTTRVEGAAYREDFVADASVAADVALSANGGSVRLAQGRNFHFWPSMDRVPITPTDIGGVTVLLSARVDPTTVTWGAPAPCFGVSVGADYWTTSTAQWNDLTTNQDVGIGRFKRPDTGWRLVSMTTGDASFLNRHPLPTWTTASELR